MGLVDIFRPRWKHRNPEIRKAAVEKIAEIAIAGSDYFKKTKAAEKLVRMLNDEKSPEVHEFIIDKLGEVVVKSTERNARVTAVRNIKDNHKLHELGFKLADHFIIRLCILERNFGTKKITGIINEEPEDKDGLIATLLIDNGYALGRASVDFKVIDRIPDEAYMTTLVLKYRDKGHSLNAQKSKIYNLDNYMVACPNHNVMGTLGQGMLVVVYHD